MHRAAKNLKRAGVRPMLRSATIALGMVALMVTINLLSSNPFTDGVAAVAETGGWDVDQVTFQGGSYGHRLFYAIAEVNVVVDTPEGRLPVHLEMSKLALFGWSVQRFEVLR
jgi:hypothetical protein